MLENRNKLVSDLLLKMVKGYGIELDYRTKTNEGIIKRVFEVEEVYYGRRSIPCVNCISV